jgi:hypothetical protein
MRASVAATALTACGSSARAGCSKIEPGNPRYAGLISSPPEHASRIAADNSASMRAAVSSSGRGAQSRSRCLCFRLPAGARGRSCGDAGVLPAGVHLRIGWSLPPNAHAAEPACVGRRSDRCAGRPRQAQARTARTWTADGADRDATQSRTAPSVVHLATQPRPPHSPVSPGAAPNHAAESSMGARAKTGPGGLRSPG